MVASGTGLWIIKDEGLPTEKLIVSIEDQFAAFIGSFTTPGVESGFFIDPRLINRKIFLAGSFDDWWGLPTVTQNLATGRVDWIYDTEFYGMAPPPFPNMSVLYGAY